jgi:hypothetical protein
MAETYGNPSRGTVESAVARVGSTSQSWVGKLRTAAAVARRDGPATVLALVCQRAAEAAEFMSSAIRARLHGEANRWYSLRHIAR